MVVDAAGNAVQGRGGRQQQQEGIDPQPYLRLLQRIDSEVPQQQAGDLLVFVAGMADIMALMEALKAYAAGGGRLYCCVLLCTAACCCVLPRTAACCREACYEWFATCRCAAAALAVVPLAPLVAHPTDG